LRDATLKLLKKVEKGGAASEDAGIFGATVPVEDAQIVLLPVPWDATASYGKGAAQGPAAILRASHQIDLYDLDFGKPYWAGITMLTDAVRVPAVDCRDKGVINLASKRLNAAVYQAAKALLAEGKYVGVVGGDHSAPYGLIQALAEKHKSFGVLHIDAHHDLRKAYEGYDHSHASIMYNIGNDFKNIEKIVSVGIRDFSAKEFKHANSGAARITTFYDVEIYDKKAMGSNFNEIAQQIIQTLPETIYISFDIDGLSPTFCPGTGTPVPGGFSFNEIVFLINAIAKSHRRIIGFDLCEVAPVPGDREWNANVGARVLYKLCGAMCYANQLLGS